MLFRWHEFGLGSQRTFWKYVHLAAKGFYYFSSLNFPLTGCWCVPRLCESFVLPDCSMFSRAPLVGSLSIVRIGITVHPLLAQHSALTDPASGKVLIALCWHRLSRILPSGRFRLPVRQRGPALTDPAFGKVSIAGLQLPFRPGSVHPPSPRRGALQPLRKACLHVRHQASTPGIDRKPARV